MQTTICFLIKGDSILLAMKKRGHGAGKWNGVGGKLIEGETAAEAAVRETQEEIGVTPKNPIKVGLIDFIFPPERNFNHSSTVYLCMDWEGEPVESDEMMPQWFAVSDIPYAEMWPDDVNWLPEVLNGKKIVAKVEFDADNKVVGCDVREVTEL